MNIAKELLKLCESLKPMNESIDFKMTFKGFQDFLTSRQYGFEDISTSRANRLRVYSRMRKSDLILTFDKTTNKLLNYSTLDSKISKAPAIDLTDHFTDGQTPRDFITLLSQTLPEFKLSDLGSSRNQPKVKPKSKEELIELIRLAINRDGLNCNLNFIDTSLITDMSYLFYDNFNKFNGDISKWDTSNVTNMNSMFFASEFNRDISNWDVSNVTDLSAMFKESKFNGDISKWNTSKVTSMERMFGSTIFNGDISNWDTSKVTDMSYMFSSTIFNGDISKWNTSKVTNMDGMFFDSDRKSVV